MCDNNFPSLVASLVSWRSLAASTSSFLHVAMNLLRPLSVTISTHTSASIDVAFQSPAIPNARMSLCTQWVHYFSFPPRPLRTTLSRFPNMICFGSRPPPIRKSAPAHKSLLLRNVVSMLSYRGISRARLCEIILWSGLLRCAPMMRSRARWCTVRSLAYVAGEGSTYCIHVVNNKRRALNVGGGVVYASWLVALVQWIRLTVGVRGRKSSSGLGGLWASHLGTMLAKLSAFEVVLVCSGWVVTPVSVRQTNA